MIDGILLIDKPKAWTSFDVVNKIRRLIQTSELNVTGRKRFPVGHTGTLDPSATGLLVVVVGKYTKKASLLTKSDKVYEVTMCLGATTKTGDEESDKIEVSDLKPTLHELQLTLKRFVGHHMQTPPIYSAIKIHGQRAYRLARQGGIPELQPRPIDISSIVLRSYDYPYVRFTAHVSSGTYIRSLVEDIGKALTTGAYLSDLCRTQVGPFLLADAIPCGGINTGIIAQNIRLLES